MDTNTVDRLEVVLGACGNLPEDLDTPVRVCEVASDRMMREQEAASFGVQLT
jgi:hypothetical protein